MAEAGVFHSLNSSRDVPSPADLAIERNTTLKRGQRSRKAAKTDRNAPLDSNERGEGGAISLNEGTQATRGRGSSRGRGRGRGQGRARQTSSSLTHIEPPPPEVFSRLGPQGDKGKKVASTAVWR
ncbi:unnamed protein product [Microthlaspi erraticum]|uniref:Uncharacterized protein n=1 Tax=Microthlaspi erraticum TaxID=1685480 RepID=A0A6D2KLH6_9BRAS|nr:unnamed protein product [Microthlaspi erraticum]